ncbi:MAG TPA: DUF4124 domain-containing protein [Geobacteraceae bacterium]
MKTLLLVLLLAAAAAHAETYKWIDSEGTTHFSDSRVSIPEKYRERAKSLEMGTTRSSGDTQGGSEKSTGEGMGEQLQLSPQVEGLKERMMDDEGIMSLIRALKDDPQMRALLNDPAAMKAIQGGDIGSLMSNPAFLKLLDDRRVREIEERLKTPGGK